MTSALSDNTKAILLLTAPLAVGRSAPRFPLLTLKEYNEVARRLRESGKQPADLTRPGNEPLVEHCAGDSDRDRLRELLDRGFMLTQAVERWGSRAIWVISRADAKYPSRFKHRLKEQAPPVLYGCGNKDRLNDGGLAVVGSRHVDDELIAATEQVGRLAALSDTSIVSGGARGVDQASVRGAVGARGTAAAVLADRLEQAAVAPANRGPLKEGRLVLASPYDPAAGFNVGHAMQRNKLIYALADAALVMNADKGKGGTWAGAVEQLEHYRFVQVFVRETEGINAAAKALVGRGAVPWPDPNEPVSFLEALKSKPAREPDSAGASLFEEARSRGHSLQDASPAETLFGAVKQIAGQHLRDPHTPEEFANLLRVSKSQAREWLNNLEEVGIVEKLTRPVRFRRSIAAESDASKHHK